MDKGRKRTALSTLLLQKAKTQRPTTPLARPIRPSSSTTKKAKPKLRPTKASDSHYIEEALRKSIELLEVVQALNSHRGYRRSQAGSPRSVSPLSDRPMSVMCNSATQTTDDKSTQVSLTSPAFRNSQPPSSELRSLRQDLRSISERLRDLSSPYAQSSGTAGILTFRSPDPDKGLVFTSSVNGPLLSGKKSSSPSEAPQGLHLSSLEEGSPGGERRLLDMMDELELS